MAAVSNNSAYSCVTNFAWLSRRPWSAPCGCPFGRLTWGVASGPPARARGRQSWSDDGPGRPLSRLPRLGPELGGRWSAFRFVLGPWRWMLVIYVFLEEENRVVVVTVQDARSSRAVRSGSDW